MTGNGTRSLSDARAKPLVVAGDALLDRDIVGDVSRICPDAPVPVLQVRQEHTRPGGAALTALLAARLHDGPVRLISRLGPGPGADELRHLLTAEGVEVVDLGGSGALAEKVRVRAGGQSLLRIDRHDGNAVMDQAEHDGEVDEDRLAHSLADAAAVVVSDYGRGFTRNRAIHQALARAAGAAPVVWDPHHNGGQPVPGCRLVTPNETEAARWAGELQAVSSQAGGEASVVAATRRAAALVKAWDVHAVGVTLGGRGAVMVDRHGLQMADPGLAALAGDTCGAGDCFAAAAAAFLAQGRLPSEAVAWAVEQAGRYVAAGGPAALVGPDGSPQPGPEVSAGAGRRRPSMSTGESGARWGEETVVATSGCFDLLHAGHVQMLSAARRLGDRLVVLLNSDAGVRRLKGPDRPLQNEADRAAVLASLASVDQVVIFDEDTPVAALERLRPQLFVKGGDYHAAELPEAQALLGWGGRAVTVPYLPDRSTTRLVEEAARRAR